jgi:hypothetical protein
MQELPKESREQGKMHKIKCSRYRLMQSYISTLIDESISEGKNICKRIKTFVENAAVSDNDVTDGNTSS